MGGRVTLKGGAEGVYVAILPERRLGVALKIADGSDRAKDAAIAGLLIWLGVLDADHPAARRALTGPQSNWRGLEAAWLRTSAGFPA
jgi:L-asparaginase II